jgi:hypothetical protein
MAKIKIPFFVPHVRGGKTLHYWQPSQKLRALGWTPVRLSDDEATAIDQARARNAELEAWRAGQLAQASAAEAPPNASTGAPLAKRAIDKAAPGTLDELIRAYRQSTYWNELKPQTRRGYDQCLERLADWAGDAPRAAISPKRVADFYSIMRSGTPALAAAIVRVGSLLWSRGRLLGLVGDANPFAQQSLKGGGKSGLIWPRAAIDWIVATADALGRPSIGTAVLVNSWIGQRQADTLRLKRDLGAVGGRALRQRKTGSVAKLPVHLIPEVAARVELQLELNDAAADAAALPRSTALLIDERTGRPWQEDTFRHVFAEIRAAAAEALDGAELEIDWLRPGKDGDDPRAFKIALRELQFMHLRHTAVVYLAEANVDVLSIAAITGHSPKTCTQILDTYGVKTGRLAGEAFKRRLAHEAKGTDR